MFPELDNIDTKAFHPGKLLEYWQVNSNWTSESLLKLCFELRSLHAQHYSVEVFSVKDLFSLWNKLSSIFLTSDVIVLSEIRYYLMTWLYVKLSKGKQNPSFSINDKEKLLRMILSILDLAQYAFSIPDFIQELLQLARKIYQGSAKSITQPKLYIESCTLVLAQCYLAFLVLSLKHQSLFENDWHSIFAEFVPLLSPNGIAKFYGYLSSFLNSLKKLPLTPDAIKKIMDEVEAFTLTNRVEVEEAFNEVFAQLLLSISDFCVFFKNSEHAASFLKRLESITNSPRLSVLKIKLHILREAPIEFIKQDLRLLFGDNLSSMANCSKGLLTELFEYVSENASQSVALDIVNTIYELRPFKNVQALSDYSDIFLYKVWLILGINDDDLLNLKQMKTFLSEICQDFDASLHATSNTKFFMTSASIIYDKAVSLQDVLYQFVVLFSKQVPIFVVVAIDPKCYKMV
jgi:hypothetical protein